MGHYAHLVCHDPYHADLAVWLFPAAAALALLITLLTVNTHSILVARARPLAAPRHE